MYLLDCKTLFMSTSKSRRGFTTTPPEVCSNVAAHQALHVIRGMQPSNWKGELKQRRCPIVAIGVRCYNNHREDPTLLMRVHACWDICRVERLKGANTVHGTSGSRHKQSHYLRQTETNARTRDSSSTHLCPSNIAGLVSASAPNCVRHSLIVRSPKSRPCASRIWSDGVSWRISRYFYWTPALICTSYHLPVGMSVPKSQRVNGGRPVIRVIFMPRGLVHERVNPL